MLGPRKAQERKGCEMAMNGTRLAHLDIKHYYTGDWKSYKKHIPPDKHTITRKKTQKIERQNLNFRTHIKRLCRKTICLFKKDDMHYGMMKAYIWHKTAA